MTVDVILHIPVDQLSTYKKNKVVAYLGKRPMGEVEKVIEQVHRIGMKDIYNCSVLVYPEMEKDVLQAMSDEAKKLSNGN